MPTRERAAWRWVMALYWGRHDREALSLVQKLRVGGAQHRLLSAVGVGSRASNFTTSTGTNRASRSDSRASRVRTHDASSDRTSSSHAGTDCFDTHNCSACCYVSTCCNGFGAYRATSRGSGSTRERRTRRQRIRTSGAAATRAHQTR